MPGPTVLSHPRTVPELEGYFSQYPDVPREVVIKADLLSLGMWFSDAALQDLEGREELLVKSYMLFSYDLVSIQELKRREHRKVPQWFVMRGGPYDLRPVLVETRMMPDAPYQIDLVDGKPMVCLNGTPLCDINTNARQMKRSRDFSFNAPVKSLDQSMQVADAIEQEATQATGFPIPLHGRGDGFLMRHYYALWKKYGLPWPHWHYAMPERRVMAPHHGTYDDFIYLMELSDYTARVDRALNQGLRGAVTSWANLRPFA